MLNPAGKSTVNSFTGMMQLLLLTLSVHAAYNRKLTLVARRRSTTLLKPGCSNVNHLLLVQGWEVCSPASNPAKLQRGQMPAPHYYCVSPCISQCSKLVNAVSAAETEGVAIC